MMTRNWIGIRLLARIAFVAAIGSVAAVQAETEIARFTYKPSVPEVELGDTRVDPEFTRQKMLLTGKEGEKIPLLISLPAAAGRKPFPVVIMFHGAVEDRKENLSNMMSGRLARRGIACISMDLPGHGERSRKDHPDFKPSLQRLILRSTAQRLGNAVDTTKLPGMDDAALTAASEAVAQGWQDSVIDGRRVIDYLETRTDIDAKRIFAFGQSMGGDIAFWLTASDPRIAGLATGISGAFDVTAPTAVAMRPYMSAESLRAFGEQIAPKPVLVIASKDDPLVAVADYQRLIDVLKKPKVEWIAQKHNITRPGFDAVAEWFAQQLGDAPTTQPAKNP